MRWTMLKTWYIFNVACHPSSFLMAFSCINSSFYRICVCMQHFSERMKKKQMAGKMRTERKKKCKSDAEKSVGLFFLLCCSRIHVRFIDTLHRVPVYAYGVCEGATEMDKLRDNWSHSNISHLILWPAAAFIPLFSQSLSLAWHRKSSSFIKWHGSSCRDIDVQTSEWIDQRTKARTIEPTARERETEILICSVMKQLVVLSTCNLSRIESKINVSHGQIENDC